MTLMRLRRNVTFAELGEDLAPAASTAWGYLQEIATMLGELLAVDIDDLAESVKGKVCLVDGTLVTVFNWRHRNDLFSGKHRQYGMNVQVVADLHGQVLSVSRGFPGSWHDMHSRSACRSRKASIPARGCRVLDPGGMHDAAAPSDHPVGTGHRTGTGTRRSLDGGELGRAAANGAIGAPQSGSARHWWGRRWRMASRRRWQGVRLDAGVPFGKPCHKEAHITNQPGRRGGARRARSRCPVGTVDG